MVLFVANAASGQQGRVVPRATSFDEAAPGLTVTFSAGLALFEPGLSLDQAVERADQAMYRAKTGGRNRTELA